MARRLLDELVARCGATQGSGCSAMKPIPIWPSTMLLLSGTGLSHVVIISSFQVLSVSRISNRYALAHETVIAKLALSNSTLYSCLPGFTQKAVWSG